jgi:glycine C-acetyltransferase/8-amino-7-oxononanoate synthase
LGRRAKALVATSPSPLPAAAASAWALDFMRNDAASRARLRANVARARAGLGALGWELPDSPVPIICLRARSGVDLAQLQAGLFDNDLCVAHVTSYSSTPEGGALRIAIFATHEIEQIDRLVEVVGRML